MFRVLVKKICDIVCEMFLVTHFVSVLVWGLHTSVHKCSLYTHEYTLCAQVHACSGDMLVVHMYIPCPRVVTGWGLQPLEQHTLPPLFACKMTVFDHKYH